MTMTMFCVIIGVVGGVILILALIILLSAEDGIVSGCLIEGLYIEVYGGSAKPLIRKGEETPCSRAETFSTTEDGQEFIDITLLRGFFDRAAMNTPFAKYRIRNVPPGPAGKADITVEFRMTVGGSLRVTAELNGESLEVECLSGEESRMILANPPEE